MRVSKPRVFRLAVLPPAMAHEQFGVDVESGFPEWWYFQTDTEANIPSLLVRHV